MSVRPAPRLVAVVTAAVALVVTLLPASVASACSCAFQGPEEALSGASAAFVGELVGREGGTGGFGPPTHRWTFAVEAVLAGELGPTVQVDAMEDDGGNCGLGVAPGERVGLLLHPTDAGWSSSSCATYDADELLAAGDPRAPDPALAAEEPPADGGPGWPALAATVAAAVAALAAVAAVARRRSTS